MNISTSKLNSAILIVFASIFMAACSTTTQPGDYYVYDNPDGWLIADSGCRVNRYYLPDNADSVRWSGDCIDGFAIGKGQLRWREGVDDAFWQTCLQPEHPMAYCFTGGSKP